MNKVLPSFLRFETSSTTMIFCLHLLAHHQKIQDKARESIKSILIKHNGQWSYDAVMEMNFVEQIIEGNIYLLSVSENLLYFVRSQRNLEALSACERHPSMGNQRLPSAERINTSERNSRHHTHAGVLARFQTFS